MNQQKRTEIIKGMCVLERDGMVLMCDKVIHRLGKIDAVPAQAIKHPGGYICESYAFPRSREITGGCALCSIPSPSKNAKGKNLNPIKASKRI